ncbi:MAG TPA: hypothetical protein VJ793_13455 [Anaerolineae bacterium]|nr:hypothetical protein [Anaerolineae bacterium]
MALYGNIGIEKGYCKKCSSTAFIKNGRFVCCNTPVAEEPKKFHRESEAPQQRKTPPRAIQKAILKEQDNRCFYCHVQFGSIHFRNGKPIAIKLNWGTNSLMRSLKTTRSPTSSPPVMSVTA